MQAIAEIDQMLAGKGKGDPHGLRSSAAMTEAEVRSRGRRRRSTVPRHVAIIMDGNGRWAAARGLPRVEGHRRGVEALRRTVRAAGEIGIRYLTIFSFSSENWSRPASEVRELMGLLRRFIRNDLAELHRATCACASSASATGLTRHRPRCWTRPRS